MAASSTRKKIKAEGVKMLYDLENAMQRLKRINELASGGSPVIEKLTPPLIELLDVTHGFVEDFRQKL